MRTAPVPVEGYEDRYEVTDEGDVFVLQHRWGPCRKKLKPQLTSGYYSLVLSNVPKGLKKLVYVHRLIAEAFLEKGSMDADIRHKNNDRADNRAANLAVRRGIKTECKSKPLPVPGYEDRYEVTEEGDIVSLQRNGRSGRWKMVPVVKKGGYCTVAVSNKGSWGKGPRTVSIHRAVAIAFLGPPKDGQEVNHKDGDKLNNGVKNLEWVSASQNQIHSHQTGLHNEHGHFKKRAVVSRDITTGVLTRYYCINEASRAGYKSGAITLCCQGKQKIHHGCTWEYVVP